MSNTPKTNPDKGCNDFKPHPAMPEHCLNCKWGIKVHPYPDTQSNERKWRNKSTGTVYASVEHNGTVIATVTTDAGSTYNVRWDKLEEVTSPTQSDKTVEEILKSISPGVDEEDNRMYLDDIDIALALPALNNYISKAITNARLDELSKAYDIAIDTIRNKSDLVQFQFALEKRDDELRKELRCTITLRT